MGQGTEETREIDTGDRGMGRREGGGRGQGIGTADRGGGQRREIRRRGSGQEQGHRKKDSRQETRERDKREIWNRQRTWIRGKRQGRGEQGRVTGHGERDSGQGNRGDRQRREERGQETGGRVRTEE